MKEFKNKKLSPKFSWLLEKLNTASEKKQMSILLDHPWGVPSENVWLKKETNIAIYGTPYYELASEEERMLLSVYETGAWWNTFIIFENLVSEYYMKIINFGTFKKFPEIVRYMHHFCKEEIVHALVFRKAMNHFNVPPFPPPIGMKEIYDHEATISELPIKAIYFTILIEWLAENNAMEDCNSKDISPLSRAVAVEHHKEEARHIEWGKSMVREFIDINPGFIEEAQKITAPFLRNMLDMALSSIIVYERVGFKNPAFKDYKKLIPEVLNSENRKMINCKIMAPLMRFFIEVGICDLNNKEIWIQSGFEQDMEDAVNYFKKNKADSIEEVDNVMNVKY